MSKVIKVDEKRNKLGRFKKGIPSLFKGKHHTTGSKKALSESARLQWKNPEYKKFMQEQMKGKNPVNKGKTLEELYGKARAEEIRANIRRGHLTPEYIEGAQLRRLHQPLIESNPELTQGT